LRPRRLLAIKFYGLGNLAMILPVLQELKATWPDLAIDVLTLPGNATLLEQSGVVRRVLTTDVSTTVRFVRSVLRLFAELRRGDYDVVLDFEQFLKVSGIFAFLTHAARRLGLNTEGQQRAWLYTTRIAYTDSEHTVDVFRRLWRPVRGDGPASHRVAPARAGERPRCRARATRRRRRAGRCAARHDPPRDRTQLRDGGGQTLGRRALRGAGRPLVARHGVRVVFTGQGAEERALVQAATSQMRHAAVDLCDQLDVPALTALVAEASFVIANDTSVMHLAGIVGTPVVALFGPTAPSLYGPRAPHDLVFYKQPYCSPVHQQLQSQALPLHRSGVHAGHHGRRSGRRHRGGAAASRGRRRGEGLRDQGMRRLRPYTRSLAGPRRRTSAGWTFRSSSPSASPSGATTAARPATSGR
jgi:ADP-heptose:LPS heptosyltransferase